jgi:hypothetical protein
VDEISGKWMKTAISSEADEKNSMSDGVARRRSLMERPGWPAIPTGRAGQTDTQTGAQRRAHGCPTESGSGPTEGAMGARRRAGLRGWPNGGSRGWLDGGLYKCCWPSFLGTLLQCLVSPTRNVGAQGANDEGRVSGGGPTAGLGGGPMGDYISVVGPHFWALSSSA